MNQKVIYTLLFLGMCLIVPYGIYKLFMQFHVYQLRDVPVPPNVVTEYAQLSLTTENFVTFSYNYETNERLIDVIHYYEVNVNQQGWDVKSANNNLAVCYILEQNDKKFIVEILQSYNEVVRVSVLFPNSQSRCT